MNQPPQPPSYAYSRKKSLRPADLVRRPSSSAPFTSPLNQIVMLWNKDPAYKVLFIAITTILVSSIVCIVIISHALHSGSTPPAQTAQITTNNPQTSTPTATNLSPTVSQPIQTIITPTTAPSTIAPAPTPTTEPTPVPAPTPTPTIEPTPVPTPTPSTNQPLQVTLDDIASPVKNNTTVAITVTTNQPDVEVQLFITYTVYPVQSVSEAQTTNNEGQVTFDWMVRVRLNNNRNATARITAIARTKNGPPVSSQTITVEIVP